MRNKEILMASFLALARTTSVHCLAIEMERLELVQKEYCTKIPRILVGFI